MSRVDMTRPPLERQITFDDAVRRGALQCVPAERINAATKNAQVQSVREILALPLDITSTFGAVMHEDVLGPELLHLFAALMAQVEVEAFAKRGVYIDFRTAAVVKAKTAYATGEASLGALVARRTLASRAREDVLELRDRDVMQVVSVCESASLEDPRDAVLITLQNILDYAENRGDTAKRLRGLAIEFLEKPNAN
jgi:hypothetical protein